MFEKIYSSSLKFLFPLSPAATYKTVVNEAVQLVGGKYGSLFLERSGRLKRMHASDPILYKIKPREHGVTQTVYETGKMIIRASSKLIESHSWFKNAKIGDDLNLPLTYNGITLGVLSIIAKPNKKFTKSQVETLKLFSPLAMIAIRKALLHEELQKAFDSRELFISLAAHELKAPLTVVYTETQLIAKSLKNNHHISQEKIQRLLSAEMRLNKLISDFLDANRIKIGTINYIFKKEDLTTLVLEAVSNFQQMYPDRKVILTNNIHPPKCSLSVDKDKIHQSIINLLTNANKFSPPESKIDLLLSLQNHQAAIEIKDYGIGIKKTDLKNLTQKFFRGSATNQPGMGLGLFLTAEIIKKHQGQLLFKSIVGHGTQAIIRLPYTSPNNDKRRTTPRRT